MPTVYKSTDASSPVLTGQAGSLITVLDAVLVNGYPGKTAAGWTKSFSGTNKAAYRQGAGPQHYYRVQDDAPNPTLANGREARVRGFEAMTTVDAGTGPFPTTAQAANGLFQTKSMTDTATARPWIIVADNRTMYLWTKPGWYGNGWAGSMFGEYYSLASGVTDTHRSIIIGRAVEMIAATPTMPEVNERLSDLAALTAAIVGHYTPRGFDPASMQSAVNVGKHGNAAHSAAVLVGLFPYPNPTDGGIHLSPVHIHEPISGLGIYRGRMRGFWHCLHPAGSQINDGDTFSGTGALAGKTFLVIKPGPGGLGTFVMETSNTWETNA
jgi:hypothetical protein